jgi:hypothetical protein
LISGLGEAAAERCVGDLRTLAPKFMSRPWKLASFVRVGDMAADLRAAGVLAPSDCPGVPELCGKGTFAALPGVAAAV